MHASLIVCELCAILAVLKHKILSRIKQNILNPVSDTKLTNTSALVPSWIHVLRLQALDRIECSIESRVCLGSLDQRKFSSKTYFI